jgi:hypothetical protein
MAQLITPDYNQLVPNLSLLGTGFEQGTRISESMANREALQAQATASGQLAGIAQTQADQEMGIKQGVADDNRAAALDKRNADFQALMVSKSDEERAELDRENKELTTTAVNALGITDKTQRRLFLERKRAQYVENGRDTSNIDRALALDDTELEKTLTMQAEQGQELSVRLNRMFGDRELTNNEQKVVSEGLELGTPEAIERVTELNSKSGAAQNTVTVGAQESAFSKGMGAINAKTIGTINEQASAAVDANQSLSVLENIDIETGALEPAKLALASFATAFGIDGSKIANVAGGEAFNAEAQRIVLSVKASQKGPQTDKDEITIRKTVASLGNSKQGNQFIIDSARALNNRRIGRKEFYDQFLESTSGKFKNSDGVNADSAWSKFKRETPMISANQRTPEGLPVFYYKFEEAVRSANPDATRGQILEAWRAREKRAK